MLYPPTYCLILIFDNSKSQAQPRTIQNSTILNCRRNQEQFKIRKFKIAGVAENNSKFKTQNSKFKIQNSCFTFTPVTVLLNSPAFCSGNTSVR